MEFLWQIFLVVFVNLPGFFPVLLWLDPSGVFGNFEEYGDDPLVSEGLNSNGVKAAQNEILFSDNFIFRR